MIWSIVSLTGLILSIISFVMASISLIVVIALKNSTHKITMYDPLEQSFSDFGKDQKESITKSETLESIQ